MYFMGFFNAENPNYFLKIILWSGHLSKNVLNKQILIFPFAIYHEHLSSVPLPPSMERRTRKELTH
jgi:hypothetical protein